MLMRALNKNQEALTDFKKAIELDPTHITHYYCRALLCLKVNQLDTALEDINKIIASEERGNFYLLRGKIYHALKKKKKQLKISNR